VKDESISNVSPNYDSDLFGLNCRQGYCVFTFIFVHSLLSLPVQHHFWLLYILQIYNNFIWSMRV